MFRLLRLSKNIRGKLAVMTVVSVIYAAFSLAAPYLLGQIIDGVTDGFGGGLKEAEIRLVTLALVFICAAGFSYLVSLGSLRLSQDAAAGVRQAVFQKFNRVSIKELDSRAAGDLLARAVADTEILTEGLLQGASRLISDITLILGTIGFLLYINVAIAGVVVALTPLSALAAALIARGGQKYFNKQAGHGGEMSAHLSEYLGGIKTVKASGTAQKAEAVFDSINNDFGRVGTTATFFSTLVNPSARLVNNIIFACVAGVGAVMCVNGSLSAGLLSAALAYVYQYGKPFNELSGISTELQKAAAAAKRINEILDLPEEEAAVKHAEGDTQDIQFVGNIELQNISFSYDERPFMENLNLSVAAGQKVAVVGPTGGGKTTLINLLMRFYDVTGGAIKIDGIDIRDIPRSALRKNIGMVLQESWLFQGAVADNIAFGKPAATRDEIVAAAQSARADEFINKLQNDYDTTISEKSFSEGQRQQIALSRVLLEHPPILIFDEATSNLDAQTERNIVAAIAEISRGRTTFIVAHRLVTVKSADIVIVINNGKIIERGTHDELLAANGFYKELYQKQLNSEE